MGSAVTMVVGFDRGKVEGNRSYLSGVAYCGFCSDLGLFWSWVWYFVSIGRMDSMELRFAMEIDFGG